jgi:hypothetical protein
MIELVWGRSLICMRKGRGPYGTPMFHNAAVRGGVIIWIWEFYLYTVEMLDAM